jgi:hypothetical protein
MEAFIWKFLYGIVFELSLQKGTNKGSLTFSVFLVWNFTLLGIFCFGCNVPCFKKK